MPVATLQRRRRSTAPAPAPGDTIPPSKPGNPALNQVVGEPYQLLAEWDASTDNVAMGRYDLFFGPNAGPFAKIKEIVHTHTGRYSYLITAVDYPTIAAGTTYRFHVVPYDAAGNVGPGSDSDGGQTANLSTSVWAVSSPTLKPYVYWAAGRGSSSVGGSGRDVISSGVAGSQKVYCTSTLGELRNAVQATGRRRVYHVTSGLLDGGVDNSITVSDDNLTLIDMSPGYGMVLKGTVFVINGLRHMAIMNMNVFSLCGTVAAATSHNCLADFSSGDVEQDHWIAYNAMAYATDQTLSYYYPATNIGTFANIFMRPTHYGTLHPEGPHGAGVFYGWRGNCQQISSLRDIFVDCVFRVPLSGAAQSHLADGLVCNYGQGSQFEQQGPNDGAYPTLTTAEHMLFLRGANHAFARPFQISTPGTDLHAGSRIAFIGNRAIGITDTTQALMVQNGGSIALESVVIPGTVGNGYASNPITDTLAARIARAQQLCNTSGPRPLARLPYTQSVLDTVMANASSPGSAGSWLTRGSEVFPSYAPATVDLLSGADPMPGVASQSAAGVDVSVAGRTLITGGIYDGYSALDAWEQRRLLAMGIGP